jgi:hypothetical protein
MLRTSWRTSGERAQLRAKRVDEHAPLSVVEHAVHLEQAEIGAHLPPGVQLRVVRDRVQIASALDPSIARSLASQLGELFG